MIELYLPLKFCKGGIEIVNSSDCASILSIDMRLVISNDTLQDLQKDLERLLEKY